MATRGVNDFRLAAKFISFGKRTGSPDAHAAEYKPVVFVLGFELMAID